MSLLFSQLERKTLNMNRKENFYEALDAFIQFPNQNNALRLLQACNAVWNVKAAVKESFHHDVEAAIDNFVEFDQWCKNGRTFAGAAQRIRPVLLSEWSKYEAA